MMEKITLRACPKNAGALLAFVTAELVRHGFPAAYHSDVLVAAEEIFVNIASYAYPPDKGGEVSVSVSVDRDAVIRFEDMGQPYNPLERGGPNLDVPLIEREIGGLGIYFVKNLMDKVEYEHKDGKNILTMTKSGVKQ